MLGALYDFFYNTLFSGGANSFYGANVTIMGQTYSFKYYVSTLCALISDIFIFVLCCLFIWKLIKLVGRLFSGGAL